MKVFRVFIAIIIMLLFIACDTVPAVNEIKEYEVKFLVEDKEISVQTIQEGKGAVAPNDPTKEGYTFIGWDQDFSNITSNLIINALFEVSKYEVKFLVDNLEFDTQTIEFGESVKTPTNPTKEGYTFIGWDQEFSNVTSDLIINALFEINKYEVKFIVDGNVIDNQFVEYGKGAIDPNPTKVGYEFLGWDQDFGNVKGDLIVNGSFKEIIYIVNFMVDGGLYDSQTIKYNEKVITPENPKKEGYIFVGWDQDFENITSNLTINAVFKEQDQEIMKELNQVVDELDKYFSSISMPMNDMNIELIESFGRSSIAWETSDKHIISLDGVVKSPYTSKKYEEVILSAKIQIEDHVLTKSFNLNVGRKYKDLSNGINAAYNSGGTLGEAALVTYDIVYYSFLYLAANDSGNLKNAISVKTGINRYKDKLHEKGGRALFSFVAQSGTDINNLRKIVNDDAKLEVLVQNLLNFCKDNDLDGIDVDWETPGSNGGEAYTKLIKKIYEVFKAENPNYLVTSAIGAGPWQYHYYNLDESAKYHDYINMMGYDMQADALSSFQNALYSKSSYTAGSCSIHDTVRMYNESGVKNSQIIVGIPFYGRVMYGSSGAGTKCNSGNDAVNQSTISRYLSSGYTSYYDEDCKVPYLYNPTKGHFVTYENARSISDKWKYISDYKLAGMMTWNYTQDYNEKLTIAMRSGKNLYMN